MNILILGGSGRTGKLLVQQALERGHFVNAIIRNKNVFPSEVSRLERFEGTPLNKYLLRTAMQGCDAVLSTLNISRTSDFPWAKLRSPSNFLSETIKAVIEVCNETGIKRIIVLSAWGTHETQKDIPGWFRWLIHHSNIGVAYKDHERQEELLKASDLDYTVIRPVGLTNGKTNKEIIVSINNKPKPKLTISRNNTARFMLDILEKGSYIRQMPSIFQA
jgi:putative NADH-flavin reductase